jgi:spore maturation protein CgeB
MLRQNLEALARRDPELCQRIGWPVESDHVVLERDSGEVHYRLHQGRYRLSLNPEAVDRSVAQILERLTPPAREPSAAQTGGASDPAREIFVFGLGLGEQVDALLAARPDRQVVAWERDPWLVRLALGGNDWSRELASGRLRLLMGSDLVGYIAGGRAAPPAPVTLFHPFLSLVYRNERALLEPGATTRPLILLGAGGLLADDLASALGRAGFSLYTIDVHRLSQEELDRSVRQLGPAAIAAINYTEGLAEFAAAHGCTLICWEIDPTTSALPPCRAPTDKSFLFTYRRAQVDELRRAGFVHAEYLPLAADTARRAPVALTAPDRERYGAPVSFVGSSLIPQAAGFQRAFLETFADAWAGARGAEAGAALLDELLVEQRADPSRYRIPDLLARRCPDLARDQPPALFRLARLAGEIAAADKRLAYVSRLGRFGIQVWGDDGWMAAQQAGAVYRGLAGHAAELSTIYCASLINVDLGRIYQDDIVTMRVFDVLACGGFVLAERSEALSELFEIGGEVDCYASADELEAKVELYLRHPERARAIALRGQQAVRARHSIAARVAHMLATSGLNGGQVGR